MIYVKAFLAGFASTLVFHQGVLWLLYAGGSSPRTPWNMTPGPATQCACSDLTGILGRPVGHRVVRSDRCFTRWRLLDEGARDRCAGSESRRVVHSNADQGHGPRWRLGPENHRRRTAAKWRVGTRRRAANAATESGRSSIKETTKREGNEGVFRQEPAVHFRKNFVSLVSSVEFVSS